MHNIEIEGTKLLLQFPEDGTEFNRAQFLSLSRLMMLFNTKHISFDQFKVKLTYDFLNLKRSADISKEENQPIIENVAAIGRLAEPYFYEKKEEGKIIKVLNMVFYNQLLPTIKASGTVFHGPSSALFNTVYGEYSQALTAFLDYSKTGEESHLNTLIATLYRPKKWFYTLRRYFPGFTEDKRRAYNPNLTQHYAKKLKHLAPEVKHAIYLFFASCQHFIATSDALDIGGGNTIDISILFKKEIGTTTTKGLGIVGTLYSIAETKVFGDVEKVAKQGTYDVFAYLVDQHQKMKEQEKKLKKK